MTFKSKHWHLESFFFFGQENNFFCDISHPQYPHSFLYVIWVCVWNESGGKFGRNWSYHSNLRNIVCNNRLFKSLKIWNSCCSVTQSSLTVCSPMDCSMPGSALHCLPEFAQVHVCLVSYAGQPSHSLPSPLLVFSRSQHQGLLRWFDLNLSLVVELAVKMNSERCIE